VLVPARRIGALEPREDVHVWHGPPRDGGAQRQLHAGQRHRRHAACALGRLRQRQQRLPRAGHQLLGDSSRHLHHRNAHALGPREQRVALDAQRLGRPVRRGLRREIRGAAHRVVHVFHHHEAHGALLLRRQRLAQQLPGLGTHHAVEHAARVVHARLAVEHERDAPAHGRAVVVVRALGRHDAEAGKHQSGLHLGAAADAVRIGVLPLPQMRHHAVGPVHRDGVALTQRGGHQLIGLQIAALRTAGRQPQPLEARLHPLGRQQVLLRGGQPALHLVGGQKEQIGAQVVLSDRLDLRRAAALRLQQGGQ